MTLAVVAIVAAPFVVLDDHDDVTAGDAATKGDTRRPELPDSVQLTCARSGIDVPVASIRPQADGLHIEVVNELAGGTRVRIQSVAEDGEPVWDSGQLYVERGRQELIQPVPPGVLKVGCRIGGDDQERRVELVDDDGEYDTPELDCDVDDRMTLTDEAVPANARGEQPRAFVVATEAVLRSLTLWDDADTAVTKPRGYPEQRYGSWLYQPMTAVEKDGDVSALVYLAGEDEQAPASPPWTQAPRVDVCRSFLNDDGLLRAAGA